MKGVTRSGGIAVVLALALAPSAWAQEPFDSDLEARRFTAATWRGTLVQAVDECVVGTTTVGGVDACAPMNIVTDGTGFTYGRLVVKARTSPTQVIAILRSRVAADSVRPLAGKSLRVRLTVRITKRTTTTAPAVPLTWVDQVLDCAPLVVPSSGNFLFTGQLTGVLGCNLDLDLASDQYQKEVVSAAIVDAGSGEPVAVPGVRKRPPS